MNHWCPIVHDGEYCLCMAKDNLEHRVVCSPIFALHETSPGNTREAITDTDWYRRLRAMWQMVHSNIHTFLAEWRIVCSATKPCICINLQWAKKVTNRHCLTSVIWWDWLPHCNVLPTIWILWFMININKGQMAYKNQLLDLQSCDHLVGAVGTTPSTSLSSHSKLSNYLEPSDRAPLIFTLWVWHIIGSVNSYDTHQLYSEVLAAIYDSFCGKITSASRALNQWNISYWILWIW